MPKKSAKSPRKSKSAKKTSRKSPRKSAKKSVSRGGSMKFYCVKCRRSRSVAPSNMCLGTDKRQRHRLVSTCNKCQTSCFRYVKQNKVEALSRKLAKCKRSRK
jgi:hypothetical protein